VPSSRMSLIATSSKSAACGRVPVNRPSELHQQFSDAEPLLEALGKVELTHEPRNNKVRSPA
jgi:hypothetical protein